MQAKTTRAFRTISEAADELGLQPHVLRFWESKFPSFKPIKRGGGRRFYRPEDIEFLRGIKILLHDERHPIKDVQKLLKIKGVNRVVELGRSVQKAAIPKDVKDTVLVPERIQVDLNRDQDDDDVKFDNEAFFPEPDQEQVSDKQLDAEDDGAETSDSTETRFDNSSPSYLNEGQAEGGIKSKLHSIEPVSKSLSDEERQELEQALKRLTDLKSRWDEFKQSIAAE